MGAGRHGWIRQRDFSFIQVKGEARERCSVDHEMVEPYFWRSVLASVWRTDRRGAPVQQDPCGRLLPLPGCGLVGESGGGGESVAWRVVERGPGQAKDEHAAAIPRREGAGKGKLGGGAVRKNSLASAPALGDSDIKACEEK